MSDAVAFRDDKSVRDDEILYRRIPPQFLNWGTIGPDGALKIPSQAFQDQPDDVARSMYNLPGACMSVALGSVLADEGVNPESVLADFQGFALVALTVGEVRSLKGPNGQDWSQGVWRDPLPAEPWHSVTFVVSGEKKSPGMKKALSLIARWVVVPTQV